MLYDSDTVEYDVLSAGIDWLTCTAKNGTASMELERLAMDHIAQESSKGVKASPQHWQNFKGYRLDEFFFGRREHDVLLCLSGPLSHSLGPQAIKTSSNVSRLDLAVTIISNGDQLDLAHDTWTNYKKIPKGTGRPRSFKLILGHPEGQTFYLNKRVGDHFGRIYDKGAESGLAPAGLVWRYEVEFKRRVAKHESAMLPPPQQISAYVCDRVRSWWTLRDVRPPWAPADSSFRREADIRVHDADVLAWYESSVSVSIGRAISQYGLSAVLKALHLHKLVQPLQGGTHGNI